MRNSIYHYQRSSFATKSLLEETVELLLDGVAVAGFILLALWFAQVIDWQYIVLGGF